MKLIMLDSNDTSIEKIFERLCPLLAKEFDTKAANITLGFHIKELLMSDNMGYLWEKIASEFELENLDCWFDIDSEKITTVEQLAGEIKSCLKICPYCHQVVSNEPAILADDYYKNRLAYIHPKCNTPARQLYRAKNKEERIRKKIKWRQEQEKFELKRQQEIQERKQKRHEVALAGLLLYVSLVFALGFDLGVLIVFLMLSFLFYFFL